MEQTTARPDTGSHAHRASCITAALLALALTSTASAERSAYVPCIDAWADSPAGTWCRDIDVDGEGETCRFSGGACGISVTVTQADGSEVEEDFTLQPVYQETFTIYGLTEVRQWELCFTQDKPEEGWRLLNPTVQRCPARTVSAYRASRDGLPYESEWWKRKK